MTFKESIFFVKQAAGMFLTSGDDKMIREVINRIAEDARETGQAGKPDGVGLIAAERLRQVQAEGWTAKHDDAHKNGELAAAGGCYALLKWSSTDAARLWPWVKPSAYVRIPEGFKPSTDQIRNLVRAGALIAAEIDRLQRQEEKS